MEIERRKANLEALDGQELRAAITTATTEELHEEFRRGLRLTVDHLKRMAWVLIELEARGEVAIGVERFLLKLLRRIAAGKVMAEAVVRFAAQPMVMRRVIDLPPEQQQRILSDPEAEAEFTRPKLRRHSPSSKNAPGEKLATENTISAVRLASPGDVAEQIIEMIKAHPDPEAVVNKLLALDFIEQCVPQKKAKANQGRSGNR